MTAASDGGTNGQTPAGANGAPGMRGAPPNRAQRTRFAAHSDGQNRRDIRLSSLYQELKFRSLEIVYDYLEVDGDNAVDVDRLRLRDEITRAVSIVISGIGTALNAEQRDSLVDDVFFEVTGYGPLEPLLADATIDDIVVNGYDRIFVERNGRLEPVNVRFRDNDHLLNIIQRIVSPLGRRVDESSPFVDARLPDGSRVNIVVPPVMIDGPTISIRKFKPIPLSGRDLVQSQSLSAEMLSYLARCVESRLNILISGGTGAGKTTLLNILSSFIDPAERLVTIEDAAELQLRQPHVARMETRPALADGTRAVTSRDLLHNSLRMRPDRVILGEVRGGEAVEMLQAMTTGHDGSMGTIHANNAKDALLRLELLLGFGGLNADIPTLRRQIVSAINVVVQVQKMQGGVRRIVHIAEVDGLEGETIILHDRYRYEAERPHSARGRFIACSRHSRFEDRLKAPDMVSLLTSHGKGEAS